MSYEIYTDSLAGLEITSGDIKIRETMVFKDLFIFIEKLDL